MASVFINNWMLLETAAREVSIVLAYKLGTQGAKFKLL